MSTAQAYLVDARNYLEEVRAEKIMMTLEDDDTILKLNSIIDSLDAMVKDLGEMVEDGLISR